MDEPAAAVERARSRATIAVAAIAALCALHVVQLVCFQMQVSLLERLGANDLSAVAEAAPNDERIKIISTLALVGWVISGILFLRWVHAAHVAAARLGRDEGIVRIEPSAAVSAYFIPFVNLVRPYQNMSTLAWLSDPRDLELPVVRESHPAPGYRDLPTRDVAPTPWAPPRLFVGAWWGAYVLLSIAGIGVGMSSAGARDVDALIATSHGFMGRDAWFLVTGGLCIAVVRGITACQRERARRLVIRQDVAT